MMVRARARSKGKIGIVRAPSGWSEQGQGVSSEWSEQARDCKDKLGWGGQCKLGMLRESSGWSDEALGGKSKLRVVSEQALGGKSKLRVV
jgi:hypothetical protein